jgi:hypothetical protein
MITHLLATLATQDFIPLQDDNFDPNDNMPARPSGGACGKCKTRHLKVRPKRDAIE